MRIVFQGSNAVSFMPGLATLLDAPHELFGVAEPLVEPEERDVYASADVVVSTRFDESFPAVPGLKLFHVPGAGHDGVKLDALPGHVPVCNCFGHEQAIAEYVVAAMLMHVVPIVAADAHMRRHDWTYRSGDPARLHGELGDRTVGILGFGHIGRTVAARAKAFGMRVAVANRSPVAAGALCDSVHALTDIARFYAEVDFIVVTIPLTPETTGFVGAEAFAAMRPSAYLINVARGPVVDERAVYEALRSGRIAGAALDTWYRYPAGAGTRGAPADLPFHALPNVVMTPHMSGWTDGMIRRRQETLAGNINRLARGEPLVNVVRAAAG